MNINHEITSKYLSDYRERFESSAEQLDQVCKRLLLQDKGSAISYFQQQDKIRYVKGDLEPQNYKQLGTIVKSGSSEKVKRKNIDERDKFLVFRSQNYQCSYSGIKLITHPLIELLSYLLPS